MNETTQNRQKRGQQQVRQLSIAATFMTTLMILVFHEHKATISTFFQLLINLISQMALNHWLSIIVVGLISASLGYRLGRRQIQSATIQVHLEPIHSSVFTQFSQQNNQTNNLAKGQKGREDVVAFLSFNFSVFLCPGLLIVKLSKPLKSQRTSSIIKEESPWEFLIKF